MTVVGGILALGGAGVAGYKVVKNINENKLNTEPQLVVEAIDGDTIKIKDNIRVRLIGIDSPEKGECYYEEARAFAKELLDDEYVELRKDVSDKDKYDRLLRHVILIKSEEDNIIVADHIVRNGYARAVSSPPDNIYRDLLSSAQEEAKREERGIWKECSFEDDESAELREVDTEPTDPNCIIKGNISEKGYGKIFLTPGCDNYNRVKIDTRKGEQYFCTEKEAESAGFHKATNCP